MKKLFNFYLLIQLLSFNCNANDGIHKISLKNEKIEIQDFNFSITRVLDQRLNKYIIGSVQKGLSNKRFPADFEKKLVEEFGDLIINSGLQSKEKDELVLIINSIWIDEKTSATKELGLIDLDFYIAQIQNDGYLILDEQNISISKSTLDATSGHDKRIALALENGLINFQKKSKNEYINQVYVQKKYNVDSSVVKCKCIKKGIFKTSLDLYNNVIDNKKPFFDKVEYQEFNAFVKDTMSIKELRKCFAFSDGKDIYINSICYGNYLPAEKRNLGYQFGKAKFEGTFIVINDEMRDAMGQVAMSSAFGLLGALASSGMTKKIDVFMDLRKGAILPINEKFIKAALLEFPDLLEKFNKSTKDDVVMLAFIKAMNKKLNAE